MPARSAPKDVMGTNDESAISKLSILRLGYPLSWPLKKDENAGDLAVLEALCGKATTRRSPLIHRGYFVRLVAIRDVVSQFVAQTPSSVKTVQIISLGAGFDGLFFFLVGAKKHHEEQQAAAAAAAAPPPPPPPTSSPSISPLSPPPPHHRPVVHFVEVDFPALLSTKFATLSPTMKYEREEGGDWCKQLGCDLHDLPALEKGFDSLGLDPNIPTLILGECVLNYIRPEATDRLLTFLHNKFSISMVVAYEQTRLGDPFSATMCRALQQRGSPLLGVNVNSNPARQVERLTKRCGWGIATCLDMNQLWQRHVSDEWSHYIDGLEPFDEYEDFHVMCGHYVVVYAVSKAALKHHSSSWMVRLLTSLEKRGDKVGVGRMDLFDEGSEAAEKHHHHQQQLRLEPVNPCRMPFESLSKASITFPSSFAAAKDDDEEEVAAEAAAMAEQEKDEAFTPRWAHASAYLPSRDMMVVFGGYSSSARHGRCNDLLVGTKSGSEYTWELVVPSPSSPAPCARVGHTLSAVLDSHVVLFGGRVGPLKPLSDLWIWSAETREWTELVQEGGEEAPCARYRHSLTLLAANNADGKEATLVLFGGRDSKGHFLDDTWLVSINIEKKSCKFTNLTGFDSHPSARASQAAAHITPPDSPSFILLHGGYDGLQVFSDAWIFEKEENDAFSWTRVNSKSSIVPSPALYGHSMVVIPQQQSNGFISNIPSVVFVGGLSPFIPSSLLGSSLFRLVLVPETTSSSSSSPSHIIGHYHPLPVTPAETTQKIQWVRHTAEYVPSRNELVILGGGLLCFSFGSFFNPPCMTLNVSPPSLLEQLLLIRKPYLITNSQELGMELNLDSFVDHDSARKALFDVLSEPGEIVAVHVCKEPVSSTICLDFTSATRNFSFETMNVATFLDKIYQRPLERVMYIRSVGLNPRKDKSNAWRIYPAFMANVFKQIDPPLGAFIKDGEGGERGFAAAVGGSTSSPLKAKSDTHPSSPSTPPSSTSPSSSSLPRLHSCMLRVSTSPLRLWTHYDVLDNFLVCIKGTKIVNLFPPEQLENLYVEGSSSMVIDVENPDLEKYPRFATAWKNRVTITLEQGQVLFIPSLWFHNVLNVGDEPSLAVNFFFRYDLSSDAIDKKDLYGNRDPIVAETAIEAVRKALKGLKEGLPHHWQEFFQQKLQLVIEEEKGK